MSSLEFLGAVALVAVMFLSLTALVEIMFPGFLPIPSARRGANAARARKPAERTIV